MHSLVMYDLMILAIGSIGFGFYLLIKGGDWAIDGAVFLAEDAGLSKLFVGATILAFGTSVPELFASVNANLSGFPGISLGNVLGSNIANVLLVLGATAIFYPVHCRFSDLRNDIFMMLLASVGLLVAMQFNVIHRWTGAAMFSVLVAFVYWQYRQTLVSVHHESLPDEVVEPGDEFHHSPILKNRTSAIGFLIGGFVALAVGSELLVKGAVTIGSAIGVPEAIIGMTVVAFGTSLPELATCVLAALKKHTDVIIGNIVGSNLFNILSIVGIAAIAQPLFVDPVLLGVNLWVMFLSSALLGFWIYKGWAFTRGRGIALVMAYVGFISWQYYLTI